MMFRSQSRFYTVISGLLSPELLIISIFPSAIFLINSSDMEKKAVNNWKQLVRRVHGQEEGADIYCFRIIRGTKGPAKVG